MLGRHILVPVDFSDHADQALAHTLELAGKLGGRLTLLHVIEKPVASARAMGVSLDTYFLQLENEIREALDDYAERAQKAGLQCDVVILDGEPYQQILDAATSRQVDLIVMGTQGRTGLERFLLGSVAEHVVRLAPCPVLVTRVSTPTPTS